MIANGKEDLHTYDFFLLVNGVIHHEQSSIALTINGQSIVLDLDPPKAKGYYH